MAQGFEPQVILCFKGVVQFVLKVIHVTVIMYYTSCVWLTWREHQQDIIVALEPQQNLFLDC